ncbi:MAG: UDP-2,4-diacetamido-2,4,6-trideoxy-beta-L-altropyranose hydrolase [Pseudomonadota bacterium]
MAGERVLLRADGGGKSGIGHLMRCLALADALAIDGAKPALWTQQCPEAVADIYDARGYTVLKAPPREASAAWLVVDSYDIEAQERARLKTYAHHMLVIDDLGNNGPYACALALNPNPGARTQAYGDAKRVLAGADYVLLRKELLGTAVRRRTGRVNTILVSCGGTDPAGAAPTVLEALKPLASEDMHIRVLVGVGPVQSLPADLGAARLEYVEGRFDMAAQLEWADAAIVAAGTVQWEAAYLGCPFVAVVIADNQLSGAQNFARLGGSMHVDWRVKKDAQSLVPTLKRLLDDDEARALQARKAQGTIDGHGAKRVVEAMAQMV